MNDLLISHANEHGVDIVAVAGELDLANQGQLRDVINELLMHGPAEILVDLTATTFIDSVSLGTLVGARRKAHTLRGTFALVLGNQRVRRVFEITGLDKVFTTYESLEAWRTHISR
ncbi:MAG: anti-sigma-factor antagonist [Marmoricola sp.]|nr:anti-sigma-factor antagonist [Marmoricola sp.]